MQQLTFTLDESCIRWYAYHFHDTILRNDISWRSWHLALQRVLNAEQLEGMDCAMCGRHIPQNEAAPIEYLGGYSLRTCLAHSEPQAQGSNQAAPIPGTLNQTKPSDSL